MKMIRAIEKSIRVKEMAIEGDISASCFCFEQCDKTKVNHTQPIFLCHCYIHKQFALILLQFVWN